MRPPCERNRPAPPPDSRPAACPSGEGVCVFVAVWGKANCIDQSTSLAFTCVCVSDVCCCFCRSPPLSHLPPQSLTAHRKPIHKTQGYKLCIRPYSSSVPRLFPSHTAQTNAVSTQKPSQQHNDLLPPPLSGPPPAPPPPPQTPSSLHHHPHPQPQERRRDFYTIRTTSPARPRPLCHPRPHHPLPKAFHCRLLSRHRPARPRTRRHGGGLRGNHGPRRPPETTRNHGC